MATGVMVSPLVVARGAGLDEAATSWLVFAALFAAGLSTWLQAMQLGRVGGGRTLFVGSNVAFVGLCVNAIQAGGLPLMATLVCVSSLEAYGGYALTELATFPKTLGYFEFGGVF